MAVDLAAILPLPSSFADNATPFVPVAGEPPLVRVVRTMPGAAVVATTGSLADQVRETLATHGLSAVGVVVVEGRGSRAQCLSAGLQYLKEQPRHVLIHDVCRPLSPTSLRDRVIGALRAGNPVVMPMLAVTDSVKAVDARGSVTATLDRSTLRAVQYPRGFTAVHLSELLAQRASDEFDELDEALRNGSPVTYVDGDSAAFAVELPRDTSFVEAVIAAG
jgi:2-C-methyl-D-erythritol 4-phosphate cytidylyltransferase